jgi:hypothetical protein
MYRRLLLAAPLIAAPAIVSFGTVAGATATSCFVGDRTHPFTGGESLPVTTLQAAVNAATSGDVLIVNGICYGDTVINKDLTVRGRYYAAGAHFPHQEALNGTGTRGSVVTIPAGVSVSLSSLVVQGGTGGPGTTGAFTGGFTVGGGIDNAGALTLGNVLITGNTASAGGGIYNETGTITAPIYAYVPRNTATDPAGGGGGIYIGGGTVTATELQIAGNTAAGDGGGVFISSASSLALVPSSSVTANTAKGAGGGIFTDLGGALTLGIGTRVSGNLPTDICTL